MIISENLNPPEEEFRKLMQETDKLLNREARANPRYFASRGGNPLEDDVKAALEECAENTPFKGTILKVSGQRFPDIVAKAPKRITGHPPEAVFWNPPASPMCSEFI